MICAITIKAKTKVKPGDIISESSAPIYDAVMVQKMNEDNFQLFLMPIGVIHKPVKIALTAAEMYQLKGVIDCLISTPT